MALPVLLVISIVRHEAVQVSSYLIHDEPEACIACEPAAGTWGKKNQPTQLRDPKLAERWDEGVLGRNFGPSPSPIASVVSRI
jgi:hypothetical protein